MLESRSLGKWADEEIQGLRLALYKSEQERDVLLAVARAAEQDRSYSPNGLRMIHGGYDHHADTVGTCRMCAALAHPDVQRLMKEVDNAQV